MPALIETQHLTKRYRSVTALDDVSLTLGAPATVGLVGKNGAGKTTLLSILAGALEPTAGSATVCGHSPMDRIGARPIGAFQQDAGFRRGIPAFRQLMHLAQLGGMESAAAKQEAARVCELFGNTEFAMSVPERLSYGQRKRLGLAQAFMGEPDVILLDEPTAGLDPGAARRVREVIRMQTGRRAFIVSSHNLYEIQDICSRVMVIDSGRIVTDSSIEDLLLSATTLRFRADRPFDGDTIDAISRLQDISEIAHDPARPEWLTVTVAGARLDGMQLTIQSHLVERGYSIVEMTRGRSLADGVLEPAAD